MKTHTVVKYYTENTITMSLESFYLERLDLISYEIPIINIIYIILIKE